MLFVKKTDYRSQLINFLCSSPVDHSHLAKTVYLLKFRILAKWEDTGKPGRFPLSKNSGSLVKKDLTTDIV